MIPIDLPRWIDIWILRTVVVASVIGAGLSVLVGSNKLMGNVELDPSIIPHASLLGSIVNEELFLDFALFRYGALFARLLMAFCLGGFVASQSRSRWQIYGSYIAIGSFLAAYDVEGLAREDLLMRFFIASIALLSSVVSLLADAWLPISSVPPLGSKAVRSFATISKGNRQIPVCIWLPSALVHPQSNQGAMYVPLHLHDYFPSIISKAYNLPSWMANYLPLVPASWREIAAGTKIQRTEGDLKYPMCLFSHGMPGMPEHYSILCQSMASKGWIVIAPTHTDGSAFVVVSPQSDGNRNVIQSAEGHCTPDWKDHDNITGFNQRRTIDLEIVLNAIVQTQSSSKKTDYSSPFEYACVNGETVSEYGMLGMGHSFGCASIASVSQILPHIRKTVMCDPYFYALSESQREMGICSSLYLCSEWFQGKEWGELYWEMLQKVTNANSEKDCIVHCKGATHGWATDAAVLVRGLFGRVFGLKGHTPMLWIDIISQLADLMGRNGNHDALCEGIQREIAGFPTMLSRAK